jgi:hypothetical protein
LESEEDCMPPTGYAKPFVLKKKAAWIAPGGF